MRTRFSRTVKVFFSPETILPFLFGATFLSVLGNIVTLMLTNLFGTSTRAALGIAVGAGLIFVVSVWFFDRGLQRLQREEIEFKQHPPDKRRGLILLVSRSEVGLKAIQYHEPVLERCWLLCSSRTLAEANKLRALFPQLRMHDPIMINDVNDPLEYCDRVNEIYAGLPGGWSERDIIADYTGMTAHGSVGMVLACLSPRRPLQYSPARLDEQLRPIETLDPIEIELDRQPRKVESPSLASGQ